MLKILEYSASLEHPHITLRADEVQSASDVNTRDFSGITIPTITESIADFVDGKPSLTRAEVGPLILGLRFHVPT